MNRTSRLKQPTGRYLAALCLTTLGIVYGDIGTSPLYAVRECFHGEHAFPVTETNVLGVLSLILWSLLIVISVKYLLYVMRADNEGEGGILALMALILAPSCQIKRRWFLYVLGLFGAALLYGDGAITPAISVLSAVEGLKVAAPGLEPWVIPISIVILIGLFWIQRKGTAGLGLTFGPVTLVWFVVLAVLGVYQLVQKPEVLAAISPVHAVRFFMHHGTAGVLVLGAVFLAVTGGESLYADMGHFGLRPIRITWFVVVLPSLLLNYFGQGAMILRDPSTASAPLFHMAPAWGLYPLIALTTAAAIIASQAVISGTYSLTRQAIMLGYSPRLEVQHTSTREIGQIYVPTVNWALLVMVIMLVVGFETSSELAAAYGIAVTSTMFITTVLAYVVARRVWGWSRWRAVPLTAVFLTIDGAFLSANSLKIAAGGWFPLVLAACVFTLMSTWKKGRDILNVRLAERGIRWNEWPAFLQKESPVRSPGTAVYLTSSLDRIPPALIYNVKLNHSLHERVVLLFIGFAPTAWVAPDDRLRVQNVAGGLLLICGFYGFVEQPDVPHLLELAAAKGVNIDVDTTTFVLGRETILASSRPGMAMWRDAIFGFMSRNARRAATFFRIPSERVLEIGSQIDL